MKIPYRDIESFVKAPSKAARVILVYGPDSGLVRERAQIMGKSVVEDLNDPFNVAALNAEILAEDPARLSDEAGAMSMMGGDRLVRVQGASDKLTPLVKEYLAAPNSNALVILEAGGLGPKSSLRKLCEKEKNAAALPCYVEDERDLSRLIRATMQEAGLNIESDAAGWLAQNIAGDRGRVRSALEKIITYKGMEKTPVSLQDAQNCCAAVGSVSLDDLLYSVAGKEADKALKSYQKLMAENVNFVVILRALQTHFRKLHITRARIDAGENPLTAVKAVRPPIFFKQEAAFAAQVQRWSMPALNRTMDRLMDLEAQCKTTGIPVETLCAQVILGLSLRSERSL